MKTVYIMVCGAGPAGEVGKLIHQAQAEGWDCHVLATPAATNFIDIAELRNISGHPVRSEHRHPGEPRSKRPPADAIIVAPATFNTVNRLAAGITGNYALDVVHECLGIGVPVVILPFVNSALANRDPFRRSVELLREEGLAALIGNGGFHPHPPGAGGGRIAEFPWSAALRVINST